MKFKFRDLLALPFIFVAIVLDLIHFLLLYIASVIGGVWSGIVILSTMRKMNPAPEAEVKVSDVKVTPVSDEEASTTKEDVR